MQLHCYYHSALAKYNLKGLFHLKVYAFEDAADVDEPLFMMKSPFMRQMVTFALNSLMAIARVSSRYQR